MRRWWFTVAVCVISLIVIVQANVAQASVEDLLYEKGQITKEEWLKLKAEHEKEEAIIQERSAIKKWFDKISIRGYVQARYTYLPGDKSIRSEYDNTIRDNTGFAFRRVRLIISGDVTDWLSFYFQPEFAGAVPGTTGDQSNNFAQIRDAYADIFFACPLSHVRGKGVETSSRAVQSSVWMGKSSIQSKSNSLRSKRRYQ
jgi:hypothetical protein